VELLEIMKTNLPRFLVIGVQKAATSWLWVQLRTHPDVWLPPVKELHYFDHLYIQSNRNWTTSHIRNNLRKCIVNHAARQNPSLEYIHYLSTLATRNLFTKEWYRYAFSWSAGADRLTGDITPEYCMIPPRAIRYAKRLLGSVKVIVMVRHPVDRAISQMRMNAGRARIDLENAPANIWMKLAEEPELLNRAVYSAFFPSWQKVFGNSALLVCSYNEVVRDPTAFLGKVESFLGLPSHTYENTGQLVHASPKRDAQVPNIVVERLSDLMNRETQFIEDNFGVAFAPSLLAAPVHTS
jgi:hypothetical protein